MYLVCGRTWEVDLQIGGSVREVLAAEQLGVNVVIDTLLRTSLVDIDMFSSRRICMPGACNRWVFVEEDWQ